MSAPYEVKCDDCKRTIRMTGSLRESAAGGVCVGCRVVREAGGERPPTVKRVDIFGVVHDTHATEAELNGWRPKQGRML